MNSSRTLLGAALRSGSASLSLAACLLGGSISSTDAHAGGASDFVWGVKSIAPGSSQPSAPPARLFFFDTQGTTFIDAGPITIGGVLVDIDGLAVLPSGALMAFEIAAAGSRLVSIAPGPPSLATPLGAFLTGRSIRGAVALSEAELLALDAIANELLRIETGTGTIVGAPIPLSLGCGSFDLSTACDLAMRSDGRLFVVDGNTIFALSPSTGRLFPLFSDTVPIPGSATISLAGCAFGEGPSAAQLFAYEINGPDDIVAYDTAAAYARSILFTNIIPQFNAGRGDLATWVAATPVEPDPVLIADLDGNGVVNGADLGVLLGAWGPCSGCAADLNCDGVVDGADLGTLLSAWGP
ncbi:MAG TPA: hypothetical protein PKC43_04645 [Phycisphaerales bacterium]|nr:hypothetical protein [Phycisphaerales bacterium]HMP36716.1 hypothetical protein [Phycisphaerales bacterium]